MPSGPSDDALARADVLLCEERVGAVLERTDPPVDAGQLGAEAGYGLVHAGLGVRAGVYAFANWGGAEAGREALEAAVPAGPGERVATAQNGVLAFVIAARIEGPEGGRAHDLLSNALSAFAGDE